MSKIGHRFIWNGALFLLSLQSTFYNEIEEATYDYLTVEAPTKIVWN